MEANKELNRNTSTVDKIQILLSVLLAAVSFLLVWNRARYGVDVTDEAFSLAEPYLLLRGSVPFASLWSQTPATHLLSAPFVAFYLLLTGGTEGIMLYYARAAVTYRAVIALAFWLLLRKKLNPTAVALTAVALFCCDMNICKGIHYNLFSISLMTLSSAVLFCILRESDVKKAARLCASLGVLMALCAIGHIVQAVNCLLFLILLAVLDRRKAGRLPLWGVYALSGLSVAAVVFAGLEIAGHGAVFNGLRHILGEYNYFNLIAQMGIRTRIVIVFIFLEMSVWAVLFLSGRNNPRFTGLVNSYRIPASVVAHVSACVYLLVFMSHGPDAGYHQTPVFFLFAAVPFFIFILPTSQMETAFRLLLCFWFPAFFYVAISCWAGNGGSLASRSYGLFPSTLLLIPFSHMELADVSLKRNAWAKEAVPLCLSVCFMLFALSTSYHFVYLDAHIPELTYQVETGIYKGLSTLLERGKRMEELEQTIQSVTTSEDTVLFTDLFPAGYLMTEAQPLTPTVWDPNLHDWGFYDMNFLRSYYEMVGHIPDKIIVVESWGSSQAVDDSRTEFSVFVRDNYDCKLTDGEGKFSLRLYEKRPDAPFERSR